MTVDTSAMMQRSRARAPVAQLKARPWTLPDVAIFVSPLLTIATAGTPLEVL